MILASRPPESPHHIPFSTAGMWLRPGSFSTISASWLQCSAGFTNVNWPTKGMMVPSKYTDTLPSAKAPEASAPRGPRTRAQPTADQEERRQGKNHENQDPGVDSFVSHDYPPQRQFWKASVLCLPRNYPPPSS